MMTPDRDPSPAARQDPGAPTTAPSLSWRRRILLATLGASVALAFSLGALVLMRPSQPLAVVEGAGSSLPLTTVTASPIGGAVTLTDHTGQSLSTAQFHDRFQLVYFGFTFCPDICPTTLLEVSRALEQIGPMADRVQPIFISVDPHRDTPQVLSEYISAFHPSFIGLTGTEDQIAAAAKTYRALYRVPTDRSDPYYTVDHSSLLYLMGPGGGLVTTFGHGSTAEDLAAALSRILSAPAQTAAPSPG